MFPKRFEKGRVREQLLKRPFFSEDGQAVRGSRYGILHVMIDNNRPSNQLRLTPETILERLGTHVVPNHVECYLQVGSTMDVARAGLSLPHGDSARLPLLVVADEQLAGRGRMGRTWVAPSGQALLFSLAFSLQWLPAANMPALVWMASLGVLEGIAAATGLRPQLKWPNDVLLEGKKVAGLLIESISVGDAPAFAVMGCGINVNAYPPAEMVRLPATSLAAALDRPVERLPLLRAILQRMDHWYLALQRGERQAIFAAWHARLSTLGQPVTLTTSQGTLRGLAEAVDESGALLVRDARDHVHVVASGDVQHGVR